MNNFFTLLPRLALPHEDEHFSMLLTGENGLVVERIVSNGHTTAENTWYDQTTDEWVMVVQGQATLTYEDATTVSLNAGDMLFIPKHTKHRVTYTSSPCIWLAIHANSLTPVAAPL